MSLAPSPIDAKIGLFGEPAWDIAQLFPSQGHWSNEGDFSLEGNALVEFSDGVIEILPIPSILHQRLLPGSAVAVAISYSSKP